MQVAIVTVGDELLAGETENANATWLADRLTERGVSVRRVLVVPDDVAAIADAVSAYGDAYDAVVVTGGLGGTPDDVTLAGVAAAFDRPLTVDDRAHEDVTATLERLAERYPDLDVDAEAEATLPAGSRPLLNDAGISPGCVVGNVYVLPGIPREMRAMFESVADEFAGDARSRTLYTDQAEANVAATLSAARDRFDVTVGCYPNREAETNRIKLSGSDPDALDAAAAWLRERVETTDPPG